MPDEDRLNRDIHIMKTGLKEMILGTERMIALYPLEQRFHAAFRPRIEEYCHQKEMGTKFLELAASSLKTKDYGSRLYFINVSKSYFESIRFNKGLDVCQNCMEGAYLGCYTEVKNSLEDETIALTEKTSPENFKAILTEHSPSYHQYLEMIGMLQEIGDIFSSDSKEKVGDFKKLVDNAMKGISLSEDGLYLSKNVERILEYESWKGDLGIDIEKASRGLEHIASQDILGELDEPLRELRVKIAEIKH